MPPAVLDIGLIPPIDLKMPESGHRISGILIQVVFSDRNSIMRRNNKSKIVVIKALDEAQLLSIA
jgi:hypothetical protein